MKIDEAAERKRSKKVLERIKQQSSHTSEETRRLSTILPTDQLQSHVSERLGTSWHAALSYTCLGQVGSYNPWIDTVRVVVKGTSIVP